MSPQMYEALVAATSGMGFGSCADCEHCRNGVKIHNTDEYVFLLISGIPIMLILYSLLDQLISKVTGA